MFYKILVNSNYSKLTRRNFKSTQTQNTKSKHEKKIIDLAMTSKKCQVFLSFISEITIPNMEF